MGGGGGALAAPRQDPHHLAVGGFPPGLQRQLALRGRERGIVIPRVFGRGGELGQGVEQLYVQLLLENPPPLLKGIAVRNRKTPQEVTSIEVSRLPQPVEAGGTGGEVGMSVGLGGGEQLREGSDVDAEGRGGVELHALARQQEPGRIRLGVPEQVAQLKKGLAEAVAGALGAVARPQKLGQVAALVGPAFDRQVRQEGARLIGRESGQRASPQRHLKLAKTNDLQLSHRISKTRTCGDPVGGARLYHTL